MKFQCATVTPQGVKLIDIGDGEYVVDVDPVGEAEEEVIENNEKPDDAQKTDSLVDDMDDSEN